MVLAVEASEDEDLRVFLGLEAAEDASVFGGEEEVLVAFTDFGVGLDDGEDESRQVGAVVGSKIGTEIAPRSTPGSRPMKWPTE